MCSHMLSLFGQQFVSFIQVKNKKLLNLLFILRQAYDYSQDQPGIVFLGIHASATRTNAAGREAKADDAFSAG